MRICIFAEGSYPYVLGGVSSWIDQLTKACPEHEFVIFGVFAEAKLRGRYRYALPSNVEVVDVFLDEIKLSEDNKGRRYRFSKEHRAALELLLNGGEMAWERIFDFFQQTRLDDPSQFFMSKNFFDLLRSLYVAEYAYTPFVEFVWTMRSMYLNLFYLLMQHIPKADMYHSVSTGYAGLLGSYAKHIYKKPFILSEHGIYTREREEEIIRASWVKGYHKDLWINYFNSLSRCAYEHADVVTTLFKTNRELQVELGCKGEKILTIPNGVDVGRFASLPQRESSGDVHIGAIARVVPIKDIKTMLLSFGIVKNSVPRAKLYVCGPTEEDEVYYQECLDLVEQLELKDVYFTGTIDVLEYLPKLDILLLTSISEGQPLAVMEGMAAGKPQVCTNVGDCRGLLYGADDHFGQAGYVESVMDYNGIATSLIKLCRDARLRSEMGRRGYNRVASLYRREDFINRFKGIYMGTGVR